MSKKMFAAFLALFMLLQIPAVVDALDDFGIGITAEAATYKLKKPVISKLTNVSNGVKISWGKVKGAAKYRVLYKTSSSGSWKKLTDTAATSYTFKKAVSGKTYYFTVRCVSSSGKTYTSSYDKTGEQVKFIAKPQIDKLVNTKTGVKMYWDSVPGASKYRVLIKTSSGWKKVADTTETSYLYKTSQSGKKYTFTVRCVSSSGKTYTSSYDTNGESITFISTPKIKLMNDHKGVKISWNAIDGADYYRVYSKSLNGWREINSVHKNYYVDNSVGEGYEFTYAVLCNNGENSITSKYLDQISKSITYVRTPKIYSISNEDNGIKLEWGSSTETYKFRVMLKTPTGWKKIVDTKKNSFLYTDAKMGEKYTFTVRSMDDDGNYISNYYKSGATITRCEPTPFKYRKIDSKTIEVYEYLGNKTTVNVPSTIDGFKVVKVCMSTFKDNSTIQKITFPSTVTELESASFANCSSLREVILPSKIKRISSRTFDWCVSLERITIPSTVTVIEQNAFGWCSSLSEVVLPSKLKYIGEQAFYNCAFKEITIPSTVTQIKTSAFSGCRNLEKFSFPDNVELIDESVLEYCSSLTVIHLPKAAKKIDETAFFGCSSLSSLYIPDSVTSVWYGAFGSCSKLKHISAPASAYYDIIWDESITHGCSPSLVIECR